MVLKRLNHINKFYNYLNLIGAGYDETESDILLLDISNNDEYIWTNIFLPASPTSSPTSTTPPIFPIPSTSPTPSSPNKSTKIGIIIVFLIGGISLLFGGLFLYKRNENKTKVIPTPGNDEINNHDSTRRIINNNERKTISTIKNHNYEMLRINDGYCGREATPNDDDQTGNNNLTNNNVYDDGREVISSDNQNSFKKQIYLLQK